jgi:hypothetical protein
MEQPTCYHEGHPKASGKDVGGPAASRILSTSGIANLADYNLHQCADL